MTVFFLFSTPGIQEDLVLTRNLRQNLSPPYANLSPNYARKGHIAREGSDLTHDSDVHSRITCKAVHLPAVIQRR